MWPPDELDDPRRALAALVAESAFQTEASTALLTCFVALAESVRAVHRQSMAQTETLRAMHVALTSLDDDDRLDVARAASPP